MKTNVFVVSAFLFFIQENRFKKYTFWNFDSELLTLI